LAERKARGCIRECHGDLHLRNLIWLDGEPVAFDGIEFNPNLRWIDVQSDIAFLYMDLIERGHPDWAQRVYNRYLERGGDYPGAAVLGFYATYRAMVRAKVAHIRASQSNDAGDYAEGRAYLELAQALGKPRHPILMITHGLSGSGKTTHSQALLETMRAIRVRSDVERKRLFGLAPEAKSAGEIYTPEATKATFTRMRDLARDLLRAGWPVIADATFLARWQRDLFRDLARECGVAFRILDFTAPQNILEDRVAHRQTLGRDASEADLAVLRHQVSVQEPLAADESDQALTVDTVSQPDYRALSNRLQVG
jgi:predicted kinase